MNFSKSILGISFIFTSFFITNSAAAKHYVNLDANNSQSIAQNSSARVAIEQFFNSLYSAARQEDTSRYISFFDYNKNSPVYQQELSTIQWVFNEYDLKLTVNNLDIVSVSNNLAEVRTRVTYQKISGPEYKDNTTTALFFLRKVNQRWKIYNAKIERVDFL